MRIKLVQKAEILASTTGAMTFRLFTDLPGGSLVERSAQSFDTAGALARVGFRFPGTMQGRLLYAQIDGDAGCRLEAVRLYIRPLDPVQEFDWRWVDLPVAATPEGWSVAKLPDVRQTPQGWTRAPLPNIAPTPSEFSRAKLPHIDPTPDRYSSAKLPNIAATPDEFSLAKIPNIFATPEGWDRAKLPNIFPTPEGWDRAKLPNIFPTPDGWDRAPLPIPVSPDADWVDLQADQPNFDS